MFVNREYLCKSLMLNGLWFLPLNRIFFDYLLSMLLTQILVCAILFSVL